jgi:hypothetical protein
MAITLLLVGLIYSLWSSSPLFRPQKLRKINKVKPFTQVPYVLVFAIRPMGSTNLEDLHSIVLAEVNESKEGMIGKE